MTSDFSSDADRSNETQDTGNDNAFARPEKEMAKMKDAIGGLSDQISDAASDIGAVCARAGEAWSQACARELMLAGPCQGMTPDWRAISRPSAPTSTSVCRSQARAGSPPV
jgi:hypothetical protein